MDPARRAMFARFATWLDTSDVAVDRFRVGELDAFGVDR